MILTRLNSHYYIIGGAARFSFKQPINKVEKVNLVLLGYKEKILVSFSICFTRGNSHG